MNKIPVFLFVLLFLSCDRTEPDNTNQFDRKAMLEAYATHLIQPAFDQLNNATGTLEATWQQFANAPDAAGLEQLKTAWSAAYLAFQGANAFNFGPAGESGLRKGLVEEIGTFPAGASKIEGYIANNDLTLNNFDRDTRGFPAMEYLLFETTNGNLLDHANRRAYFGALVQHLKNETQRVATEWVGYKATFVENNGTDAGSSTSMLYNEFVRSFEAVKNFKVGLPAGKRPGQTGPAPELSEGYYAGNGLDLLKANLTAIGLIYYGNAQINGFDAYLNSITGGEELVAATQAQWATVQQALAAVPTDPSFAAVCAQAHPSVDALHTELQKHTRFFKSDMSSLLGIAITYSSGDGD